MKRSGGRVPKPKINIGKKRWALHTKWSAKSLEDLRGFPLMVYPKTFGVHVHKAGNTIVTESGKKMQIPQVTAAMAPLPSGTDAYLTLGDIRSEFAETQSMKLGLKRAGSTFEEKLTVWPIDYRAPGNWLQRMHKLTALLSEDDDARYLWPHRIGVGVFTHEDFVSAERLFLESGVSAVEARRVCPEYESGSTANVFMVRRYVRRVARVLDFYEYQHDRYARVTFAPLATGSMVVDSFGVRCPDGAAAIGSVRLLVPADQITDNVAPHAIWHGYTFDPTCKGIRARHGF